jgi:hypothetical protein
MTRRKVGQEAAAQRASSKESFLQDSTEGVSGGAANQMREVTGRPLLYTLHETASAFPQA